MLRARARLLAQASVEWVLIIAIVGLGCVAGFRALSGEMGGVLGKTGNVLSQGDPVGPVEPDPGTPGGSGTDTPEPEPEPDPEATNETAYAMLYEDGSLIFQVGDEEDDGHGALVAKYNGWLDKDYSSENTPWYEHHNEIRRVRFKNRIAPRSTAHWFKYSKVLSDIDLTNLDTSKTESMYGMFYYCKNLTHLDVSMLDVSKVWNMRDLFCGTGLYTIDLSSWDTPKLSRVWAILYDCPNLVYADISGLDLITSYRYNKDSTDNGFNLFSETAIKEIKVGPKFYNPPEGGNPGWLPGTWRNSSGSTFTYNTIPSCVADTYSKISDTPDAGNRYGEFDPWEKGYA